jgi:hypothetical protein
MSALLIDSDFTLEENNLDREPGGIKRGKRRLTDLRRRLFHPTASQESKRRSNFRVERISDGNGATRLRLECLGARTGSNAPTLCGSGVCKGAGRPCAASR